MADGSGIGADKASDIADRVVGFELALDRIVA